MRFVGSATAGIDHVDVAYLKEAGVAFAFAPGSNADSVVDYVMASLLELATITDASLAGRTLGIVGHGAVGGRLARRAAGLGLDVLLNDPPKLAREPALASDARYVKLERLLSKADIVSIHVPLLRDAPHPTWHLVDADGLARLRDTAWLVNTARGSVIDNEALATALKSRNGIRCVLDVWESEPDPSPALVRRVDFGTPHIAGYAHDGKVGGATIIAHALAQFLGQPTPIVDLELPRQRRVASDRCVVAPIEGRTAAASIESCLCAVARQLYPFTEDVQRFQELADSGDPDARREGFERLRKEYPKRRAFSSFDVAVPANTDNTIVAAMERVLQVTVVRQMPADQVS